MAEEDEFKPGPDWEDKTSFMPGVPEDEDAIPEILYQVLLGNVYTLTRWKDSSTARGQMTLQDLEARLGFTVVKEGWYSVMGDYLGSELEGSL